MAESDDLARAREALAAAAATTVPRWAPSRSFELNPSLRAVPVGRRGLAPLVSSPAGEGAALPGDEGEGEEILLCYRDPRGGEAACRAASPADLLSLKIVAEGVAPAEAAAAGGVGVGAVDDALHAAAAQGLLLAPRPLIRRPDDFPRGDIDAEPFLESEWFTLQWHLTQACDLHCRHCYDRAPRGELGREEALAVLDDLHAFCAARGVRGAVSFSGGNPLLYPHFMDLWRRAAELGLTASILGNPAPRARIEQIVAVRTPYHFQVSLEGLEAQNDSVRGEGHFARTVAFLGQLRELGVPTMVMLTLTADNVGEVIPLARRLGGLVEDFHFNRLAMVGEGASLRLPSRERLRRFYEEYLEARGSVPSLGLKDNLLNVLLRERGAGPFGGCTGFGCGAAFNFLSLLPDGEAHACRKLPSPVGNVAREGLAAVYDAPPAVRYRGGCAACAPCAIRPVCGGCLAVAHGFGLDPLAQRDPLCLLEPAP